MVKYTPVSNDSAGLDRGSLAQTGSRAALRGDTTESEWWFPPENDISATARFFQLPTYITEPQKNKEDLIKDLHAILVSRDSDTEATPLTHIQDSFHGSPAEPLSDKHLSDLKQHAAGLADTVSSMRIARKERAGRGQDLKKVPFDPRGDAQLSEDGHSRLRLSKDGQEVKLYSVWSTSAAEVGSIGGVGLRLYFFILKFLAGVFFVMGFITLPALTSFAADRLYDNPDSEYFQTSMDTMTLGNVRAGHGDIENGTAPVLFVASETDAFATLTVVLAIMWLGGHIKTLVQETDLETITMQDYSVQVRPLEAKSAQKHSATMQGMSDKDPSEQNADWPREYSSEKDFLCQVGGDKIEQFHANLASQLDKTLDEIAIKKGKRRAEGVTQVADQKGRDPTDEHYKPAIWSAWDEEKNMKLWQTKLQLLYKLEEALGAAAKKQGQEERLKTLEPTLKKLSTVNAALKTLNGGAKKYTPVTAFVVFENPEQQQEIIELARQKDEGLREGQALIGDWVCEVVEAPEPDTVQWQHLAYSERERKIRKYIMNISTALLLFLGFLGCTQATIYSESMVYTKLCDRVLGPTSTWDSSWTMKSACPGILEGIRGAEPLLPLCEGIAESQGVAANCTQEYMDYSQLYRNAYTELVPLSQHIITQADKQAFPQVDRVKEETLPWKRKCKNWGDWRPSKDGDSASCHRVDGKGKDLLLYPGGDVDSMCYACTCKLESLASAAEEQHGEAYCEPFESDQESTAMWKGIAAVWVVAINQALKRGVKGTAHLLKAHTIGEEMSSTASRVFACQLINTVILMLLLKSELPVASDLPGEHYPSIDSKWFSQVAAPMIKTMAIQFVTPWGIHAGTAMLGIVMRIKGRRCTKTQNARNRSQAPAEFDIAGSYGEVLLAMSVILIFGSGTPLLYWVGFAGFTGRYWVDKYVVLRECRRPPMLSQSLFANFDEIFMLVLLGHAAMGCYMLTTAGGTDPAAVSQVRPFAAHVFPMYVATAFVVIAWILKMVSNMDRVSAEGGLMETCHFPPWLKFVMASYVPDNAEKEKLPRFSVAIKYDKIANNMDSYDYPVEQELGNFGRALHTAIDEAHQPTSARAPFSGSTDDLVYERVFEQAKPLEQ